MGRGRDRESGRPVEPGEARTHGNDPDAVRLEGGAAGTSGETHRSAGSDVSAEAGRADYARPRTETNREERGSREVHRYSQEQEGQRRDGSDDRGTSWISVVLGWLAALGASLILSGIVAGVVGAILGTDGARQGATEGGTAGLIGLLITLLLAFLIGGYAAGRMASRQGLKHGLLVPVVALVATLLLAGIGALLGSSLIDNLSGVTLPGLPRDTPQNLGTILTVSGILALLAPFIGGALGGALGARTGRRRP
jgi:hypothetical protein